MRVLVTGATGYIGGRLVSRLLRKGHRVRVLSRDPRRITGKPWADQVDVLAGDLLDRASLSNLVDDIDAAYYLVHSMYGGKGFAEKDRLAVKHFREAAAGVKHVIYLGGLLPQTDHRSEHLASRQEIGRLLAERLPTTEFRAGPIIGSGSASFEMLRYLTERCPLMIAPSWMRNEIQPIAVRDVLKYLIAALHRGRSGIVEIGGERLSYKQMIKTYAHIRRLHRGVCCVPAILPVWIGARFISMVTPIPSSLAVPLVQGMQHPLTVQEDRAATLFPNIKPIRYRKAVRLALARIQDQAVETRWSGALTDAPTYEYRDTRGLVREVRSMHVGASPTEVFRVFSGIGGDRGWLTWNWAWRTRGFIDRVLGGPGLKRGRRDPDELLTGEVVDFWRVEIVEPPHLLRLRAEAKMPGRGWLQWEVLPERDGTRLTQTAAFAPIGLPGMLYWYMLYPFHRLIFTDLIEAIDRLATGVSPQQRKAK